MTRRRLKKRPALTRRNRTDDVPRLRISNPEDFIAIVPYLLGFHPTDSVVAIFFDQGRVRLTARVDLAPDPALSELVAEISSLGRRAGAASVVLLVYSSQVEQRAVLERLVAEAGLEPVEALLVTPDRWWSVLCTGGCCPPDGTAYDLAGHPLCAEAVLAGLNAASDRTEVEAMVAGAPPADAEALEELAANAVLGLAGVDRGWRKRRMHEVLIRTLAEPSGLSDADCAELAALCLDLTVRDVAWARMSRDEADAHLTLWRRVLSRTVEDMASGPLGLVAMAGWISGNGALLNCCIARLEEIDPDYGLLQICKDISGRAIHPSLWDELGRDLRADPALLVS